MNCLAGSPYVAHVEENTSFSTPPDALAQLSCTASSSESVAAVLLR